MIINHNIMANNAIRNMNINSSNASKSMQKLSSGLRINSAADDAAGLAISEKMRGQISGLDQASSNAQDGISMTQTAEGALNETTSILQRMRELANQSANGTNTTADRSSIQDEMNQLTSEINRIGNTTEFNTQKLLNGGMDSNSTDKITKATGADKTLSAAFGTGTVTADTSASKTLGAITAGTTVSATAASTSTALTATSGTIGAGVTLTINDKVFNLGGTATSSDVATNMTTLNNLVATDGVTKLSDLVTLSAATATTMKMVDKTAGANSLIKFSAADTAIGSTATEVTGLRGGGDAVVVDGKVFDLSNTATSSDAATTIQTLGNITAADGTKLSDVVDITGTPAGGLTFKNKSAGTGSSIQFKGSATDTALGFTTVTDEVAQKGTDGSRIVVDNTTFNLGGVKIDATTSTTIATSIESLKAVTSGGTKLGDLVDIKNNGGKLEFTAKSTGKTSTISFTSSAADSVLGTTLADEAATVGVGNTTKGTDTTIEKAGLQAGSALNSVSDISIAANSTFKIAVGSDSDVTVTLNKSTSAAIYNTSNTDKNVSQAAMDSLVKDINSALQDAGLGGKVSASLSEDNKVQFISETGVNIEVKDGTNTPLVSKLGFTDKTTDMGNNQNIQQVVGPGAQGSGFTTSFQIGANKGQSMSLSINDMRAAALGITGNAGQQGFTATNGVTNGTTDVKQEAALDVTTKESATKALDTLDKATALVSAERGKLGAVQNRLEHTINNLGTASENLTTAESRIRDVDMAKEMSTFSKNNILSQAAQAMLAQANQQPQQVLQLLR